MLPLNKTNHYLVFDNAIVLKNVNIRKTTIKKYRRVLIKMVRSPWILLYGFPHFRTRFKVWSVNYIWVTCLRNVDLTKSNMTIFDTIQSTFLKGAFKAGLSIYEEIRLCPKSLILIDIEAAYFDASNLSLSIFLRWWFSRLFSLIKKPCSFFKIYHSLHISRQNVHKNTFFKLLQIKYLIHMKLYILPILL